MVVPGDLVFWHDFCLIGIVTIILGKKGIKMQCKSCGTELPKKAKVCPKCGRTVGCA